jgi:DNA modification methylase
MSSPRYVIGDALQELRKLPDEVAQTCVTSPPYWRLRDYGIEGQYGLEETPEAYAEQLVAVFEEVRRVLVPTGTLWLNLADTYARGGGKPSCHNYSSSSITNRAWASGAAAGEYKSSREIGLKDKDLVGIPWMVAFALRAAGWYLRVEVIWWKTNAMPESAGDRPHRDHEQLFLMSKSPDYFYDERAIAVAHADPRDSKNGRSGGRSRNTQSLRPRGNLEGQRWYRPTGRSARTVWPIAVSRYRGAHFATFPPELATRCVLAGSSPGDLVIDPFLGSGTVGEVCQALGRRWFGIELDPANEALIVERTAQQGLLTTEGEEPSDEEHQHVLFTAPEGST